MTATFQCVS